MLISRQANLLNRFIIILFAFLLIGCGSTLKNSWNNFRAYYNTFHNAKEYYKAGLDKVKSQPRELEPESPVRVHIPPVKAADEDFQSAISKGARILRKFPDSKWADNALLLIGKSYYYRMEFHPALEKFEELYRLTGSDQMRHEAIIWKGITLLDLSSYEEGASYLSRERLESDNNWTPEALARAQIAEAEHHAFLGNNGVAADLLSSAIGDLSDQQMIGRSYFLYGQMLEEEQRYGEAYYAYSQVSENFPGFEYVYWAGLKQAEVARKEGNYELALSQLKKLRKDDRYFDRRDELSFQIAVTLEESGDTTAARDIYLDILSSGASSTQTQSLHSSLYYRLGKIYSDYFEQYDLAEAYFDSASSMRTGSTLKEGESPEILAENYRTYNALRSRIQRADSLLWLGTLSPQKLDSVLQKIRIQRREQIQRDKNRTGETVQNLNQSGNESKVTYEASQHGFLDYKDEIMVKEAKAEFQLVWGRRPLVDNWRRMEAVNKAAISSAKMSDSVDSENASRSQQDQFELDVGSIPTTPEAREQLEQQILNTKYELGNLLFLNMNRPDSARFYFYQVINQSGEDSELKPRAMYSLFELYHLKERSDSLEFWGKRIIDSYPDSPFAARVKDRLGMEKTASETENREALREKMHHILEEEENSAARLRSLALANRSSELAPYIHYQAIESYIKQAKQPKTGPDSTTFDTVYSWQPWDIFTSNTEWDSVRTVLQEYDSTFTDGPHRKQVAMLMKALEEQESDTRVPTCEDYGITLEIVPDKDAFLEKIVYPDDLKGMSLSGTMTYSFMVDRNGRIESYRLESQKTPLGIEDAFEKAIGDFLKFAPPEIPDDTEMIRCNVEFPIQN